MKLSFCDLGRQYLMLKTDIDAAIAGVLERADFISGSAVRELEDELSAYVGVDHTIAVANGTDALELVLLAWGIGEGDAVFVPSFTFMSTAEVVAYLGATPVFVDVEEDTFNMDPASLEAAYAAVEKDAPHLTPRAVITVDLFGQPADHDTIVTFAHERGMTVLEDAAQGFGGTEAGRRAGSLADAATTSFFPAKPLGCYGDGGAIFTDDAELARLLRSLHIHGKGSEKYDNVRVGRNSRLDTIQAAILRVKLAAFVEMELEARNDVAVRYSEALADLDLVTPIVREGFHSSWAQYTLKTPDRASRDSLQAALKERAIPTAVYYPRPLHEQPAFTENSLVPVELPVSEALADVVISLPMHPYLTDDEIDMVTSAIHEVYGN